VVTSVRLPGAIGYVVLYCNHPVFIICCVAYCGIHGDEGGIIQSCEELENGIVSGE